MLHGKILLTDLDLTAEVLSGMFNVSCFFKELNDELQVIFPQNLYIIKQSRDV